ncbi:hypothetical protein DV735_g5351, partial [Chaetothyriales sp. CBS 134920]
MAHVGQPQNSFLNTVYQGKFLSIDERTLLHQILDAFGPEFERLKRAPCAADRGSQSPRDERLTDYGIDPSKELFEQDFEEINRTLVGVLALRWILNDEYSHFVRGQPENLRLHPTSFAWLKQYFEKNLKSREDLLALIIAIIINDVGKDPTLVSDYVQHTGNQLPDQNHDSLLYEAVKANMLPCLELLSLEQHRDLLLGLELGSELNAGQLAQAESVPISLEFLQSMKGREHAFEMKFMEQVLDVAGALGHKYPYGAKNLIQPVFEAFQTVHEVSRRIISGEFDLRQGYDEVLKRRALLLERTGFRHLSVNDDEERALLRLLTMGRTADAQQAELFEQAFQDLDSASKDKLVMGLNIDGNVNEKAVLPYYMPAVLSDVLATTKDLTGEARRRALASVMRYLARVLSSSSVSRSRSTKSLALTQVPEEEVLPEVPGIVIEHNMLKAREVLGQPDFKTNPDKLDELDVPPPQELIRRRTSQSIESPR